jgi:hypothetical protein
MPSFVVMTMRRMIEIGNSVPQDARTDATIAFVPMFFDYVRSDPGRPCGRIDRRRCKDRMWDTQESMGGPDKVHRRFVCCRANERQATPSQPDFSPGQQGMSSCISIAVICVETEDAMALPVTPTLTGPKMIPSRANANSSRWMIVTSLMRLSWHGAAAVGRGAMKMCRHVVPSRFLAGLRCHQRRPGLQKLAEQCCC